MSAAQRPRLNGNYLPPAQVHSHTRRDPAAGMMKMPAVTRKLRVLVPINSGVDLVNREAEHDADALLPGLTLQRVPPLEHLHAQASGTLAIDPSTNCLVLRCAASRLVDGAIVTVQEFVDIAWPLGWSVGIHNGKLALLDATGQVVGQLGDDVFIGGGSVDTAIANVTSCTGQPRVFVASGLTRA
ncbi:hypothetical protein [Kribbella sp. CA-294648]|uniref:hypothetical protein n=1 Tax=Kribbella sp. CA-294648 TaxID=3239948 RepID=UPI003D9457F2